MPIIIKENKVVPMSGETAGSNNIYRGKWVHKIDFLFACVGFSVGLGNIWRFPYLCYKNGGGAFLIPYFISVLTGGIPCFFLEVIMGQFMAKGGIEVWNICPVFKGIGYAAAFIVFCINTYYCVILAWAFYFLFSSIRFVVPWSSCGNYWNTNECTNSTTNPKGRDPAVEFWEINVLGLSKGLEYPGYPQWKLTLCLLLSWIVVYICIYKGIRAAGKVLYFTALTPYILMFILLIRTTTLDGAFDGLYYFLVPDFSKLKRLEVWVDAGTQIFFSYSISLGSLSALGSFNTYNYNSFRDALLFSGINTCTSLLAGLIIFSTLGFMSNKTGIPIDTVAVSGPGLAFHIYPKALAQMPAAPVWSIMFFLMIILLGLDSQFVGVEGFITAVSDIFPKFMGKPYHQELFALGVCIVNLLIGISMVTQGGIYVFLIFDHYGGARSVVLVAVFECIAITYCYGIKKFSNQLVDMLGFRLYYLPHIFWGVISPIYLSIIFILSIQVYKELSYKTSDNTTYNYPKWGIGVGWTLASVSLVAIPVVAIISFIKAKGNFRNRLNYILTPKFDIFYSTCSDE